LQVGENDQPTINPWLLEDIQAKILLRQFDQLTVDLEAQSLYEQSQIRKAARQKLRDEKAERKALEEKEKQEKTDAAVQAAATKEKNRQRGLKSWETQRDKGRVAAVSKKVPAIRRLQEEDRHTLRSPIQSPGVLKLRPGNVDHDSGVETDPDVQRGRDHPTHAKQRQAETSSRGRGSGGVLKLRPDLENSSGSRSHSRHPSKSDRDHSLPRSRVQARREEIVAGPSRSSSTRDDRGTRLSRDNRPYRDDRERRESRDQRSRDERVHDRLDHPPHRSTSSTSDTRDPDIRRTKPYIDDNGRLHPAPSVPNRDNPPVEPEVRQHHNESRGSRSSRPSDPASLRRQPYIVPTHPRTSSSSRPGTGRTDRPEFYGLSTFSHRREITGGIYHDPTRVKRETGTHSHPNRVKRERSFEEEDEEEEEELSPMEEQHRAYWQRKEEREAKRRKMAEKEERRRIRRLEAKAEVRDRVGNEKDEDWVPPASGDQRMGLDYRLDKIKLEAVGEVIH
jgi:hypothetical protein